MCGRCFGVANAVAAMCNNNLLLILQGQLAFLAIFVVRSGCLALPFGVESKELSLNHKNLVIKKV